MQQVYERREGRQAPDPEAAAAAYDAAWGLYEGAAQSCRDLQAAFDEAIERVRASGRGAAAALAARAAVDILHGLEVAELIRRRAAYDAMVATAGPNLVDRRRGPDGRHQA